MESVIERCNVANNDRSILCFVNYKNDVCFVSDHSFFINNLSFQCDNCEFLEVFDTQRDYIDNSRLNGCSAMSKPILRDPSLT